MKYLRQEYFVKLPFAKLFFLAVVTGISAIILTVWQIQENSTQTALLETENTARLLNSALLDPNILQKAKVSSGQKQIITEASASPSPLWGLKRWPVKGEIFLANRSKSLVIVRRVIATNELEFTPINGKDFFARSLGEQTNVEWLLAESANQEESSLATIESGEAGIALNMKSLTFATVAVPGTNTIVRRFFLFSYKQVLAEPFVWISFLVFTVLVGMSFVLGNKNSHKKNIDLKNGKFFLERVNSSITNDLITHQCLVLLAPDNLGSISKRKYAEVAAIIAQELNVVSQHYSLPAILDNDIFSGSEVEKDGKIHLLFALHCPNCTSKTALELASKIITNLKTSALVSLAMGRIRFSAAVVEFEHAYGATVDSQMAVTQLFDAAALSLKKVREQGGDMIVLADKLRCAYGEAS